MLRALVISAVLMLTLSSCAGDSNDVEQETARPSAADTSGVPSASPPESSPSLIRTDAGPPPLWRAETLETMLGWYPNVIVGTVSGIKDVEHKFTEADSGAAYEDPPVTVFEVQVDSVVSSATIKPQTVILLGQGGGPKSDGTWWELETSPLPLVDQTYLFFLQDITDFIGSERFTGPAFGRFSVDEAGIVAPNGYELAEGVASVSGVPFEEVQGALAAGGDRASALDGLARVKVDQATSVIRDASSRMPEPATPSTAPSESATASAAATE